MLRGELIPRQVTITWMGNRDPTHIGKFSNARIVPGPAVVVKTRAPPKAAPAHWPITANSLSPRM